MYGGSRHSKPVIRNLCSLSSCRKGLPSSSFIHRQTLPTHVMVANAQENCRLWLSTGSANESPQAKTHLRPVSYGQCLHFQGLQKNAKTIMWHAWLAKLKIIIIWPFTKRVCWWQGSPIQKELFLSVVSSKRPKTAFLGPLVPLCSVLEIFPSVSDVRVGSSAPLVLPSAALECVALLLCSEFCLN